jgi:high-affinity iron transporter
MTSRLSATLLAALLFIIAPAGAQEHPVRRLAAIVSVAIEEYGRGVDAKGKLTSQLEYQEATDFLADAVTQAARLPGDRAIARALLDSLVAAVQAKQPPEAVKAIEQRFATSLGSEGALEMPTKATNLAEGGSLYAKNCASCHGPRGKGDGPAARTMNPKPPALGDAVEMHDRSPGGMYRVLSVGVAGTPMVGFASSLSADERWNIISYVMTLRTPSPRVAEGEGLFVQRCAQCHGALGAGDGSQARTLSRIPQEIGSLAWQSTRTDQQLVKVVRDGVPGTAMPPSRDLTPDQTANVVAYLRTLPFKNVPQAIAASRNDPASVSVDVLGRLEQSLAAARVGNTDEASDRALDAYIAFEPLETPARARNAGLVAGVELEFTNFRGAVRSGDWRRAERVRDVIEAKMPSILALTKPTGSGFEAFFQSLLIILREGFEAILVIGTIAAFLIKTGNRNRLRSLWIGSGWGLAASAATALALKTLLSAAPMSRELIEGVTMLVAVGVLFSVSYWLISKVEAAKWQQFIKEKVSNALEHGGGRALGFVAFLAVYREGAETALFYQALFNEGPHVVLPIAAGILVGGAILAVIFTAFHKYGVRLPLREFFAATSVLLYYMAFVFMGKGIRELQEGNLVTITVIPGMPNIDALGLYPTVETLLGQLVLIVLLVYALVRTFWPSRSVALPTIPSDPTASVLLEAQLSELRGAQDALNKRIAELETMNRETTRSRAD